MRTKLNLETLGERLAPDAVPVESPAPAETGVTPTNPTNVVADGPRALDPSGLPVLPPDPPAQGFAVTLVTLQVIGAVQAAVPPGP